MSASGTRAKAAPRRRKAVGSDPEIKAANLNRLRRIEGQVRGLQAMIEGDRYCPEILTQIAAVQEALRSVGRELMRNHLRHCVATAVRTGGRAAEAAYDEVVSLMFKTER